MSNVTREAIPRPLKVSAAPKQEIYKMKKEAWEETSLKLSDIEVIHTGNHYLNIFFFFLIDFIYIQWGTNVYNIYIYEVYF